MSKSKPDLRGEERQILKVAISGSSVTTKSGKKKEEITDE